MFARIQNSAVVEYPIKDIRERFPNTSFPETIRDQDLPPGYVTVAQSAAPAYNPTTHKAVLSTPLFNGTKWIERWAVVPLNAEELAQSMESVKAAIVAATQARLDQFARTRGYDGILSACTYATSPTAKFATEGQYCVAARDATWAKLYAMLGEVLAGTRPVPSGYDDIKGELPALVWPG